MSFRKITVFLGSLAVFGAVLYGISGVLANELFKEYKNPKMALLINFRDAPLEVKIGDYFYNGGAYDLKRAEFAYKRALFIDKLVPKAHYQLARIYFVKGMFKEALVEIDTELKINPENGRSYYIRGLIHTYTREYTAAIADFRTFVSWAPFEWAGYNDLAFVLALSGNYKESEHIIETALNAIPEAKNNPWLLNSLGLAELNLKKYTEAVESFSKAEILAQKLTIADWKTSYPGNDPSSGEEGLESFKQAISKNLEKAKNQSSSL